MKRPNIYLILFLLSFINNAFSQNLPDTRTGLLKPSVDYLKRLPRAAAANVPDDFVPPRNVDISDKMPISGDQGKQGSCAAFSAVYDYLTYLQNFKNNTSANLNGAVDSSKTYSPKYLYNLLIMEQAGVSDCRGGVLFSKILNKLRDNGSPTLRDLPYVELDPLGCLVPLNTGELSSLAEQNKILAYETLTSFSTRQFQYYLANNYPIMIAMDVDSDFLKKGIQANPNIPFIYKFDSQKPYLGYHALVVTGYDSVTSQFKILNSWGKKWGNSGYFYMSYKDLIGNVSEAYIAKANTTTAIAPAALVNNDSRTYHVDSRGRYQGYFRLGFFKKFDKFNVGVNYVNKNKGEVIISVLSPDKKVLLANLILLEDETKYFSYNKQKINITFSGIDIDGISSLKNDVLLTLKISNDAPDPVVQKMLKL